MRKIILDLLFKRYKKDIYDRMIMDFYGDIPKSVSEPSIEFLANARTTLERFFSIQAYHIQKRSIGDRKNDQFYAGALMHIKSLLVAIQNGRLKEEVKPEVENTQDNTESLLTKVNNFVEKAKKVVQDKVE